MKRAAEKLHSRRGASLFYALLLFLVASMVSVVILSASVTAVKRMNDDREREQKYLLLASAARQIKKQLEIPVTVTETTVDVDGSVTSHTINYSVGGALTSLLTPAVKELYEESATQISIEPFAVEREETKDAEASIKMKKEDTANGSKRDYPISGSISQSDGGVIYLNAYASNLTETTGKHIDTDTVEETDDEGNTTSTTTTTTTTIKTTTWSWSVTLSTNPPKSEAGT